MKLLDINLHAHDDVLCWNTDANLTEIFATANGNLNLVLNAGLD
jgi:hypothetical protein